MLFEEDEVGVGVPHLLQELSQNTRVLEIHPVAAILPNPTILIRKSSILSPQLLHHLDVSPRQVVSVISAVVAPHLNREGSVPQVVELDAVGVSGHHGCACEPIREHGSQVVHAVPSRRVPSDEHFVGVYDLLENEALDDDAEELGEVWLPPHIGCLFARAEGQPDDSWREKIVIEGEVIFVLLVIDLFGAAPAAMESKDERVAIGGFRSQGLVLKFEGFACKRDGALLDHQEVEFSLILLQLSPFFQNLLVLEHL